MTEAINQKRNLNDLLNNSVIPLGVADIKKPEEPVEVIVATRISGGANYKNNMPQEVELARVLADGTEYKAVYKLSKVL